MDNVENYADVIESFCSNDIAICITNKDTNISHGSHAHDSYEFVICNSNIPSTFIENYKWDRLANSIFALNPMQTHGMAADLNGFNLCGIHIDKKLVKQTAFEIYGNTNIIFSNESFVLNNNINTLIRLLLDELEYKQQSYEFLVENIETLLIANILRQIKHNLPGKPHNMTKNINYKNIKLVINYMNENYANDISCTEMAKIVNMGKFELIRCFKSEIGKTPYEYLIDLKIEKSKNLLRNGACSITEISFMCGFSTIATLLQPLKREWAFLQKNSN